MILPNPGVLVALRIENAYRKERRQTRGGSFYYTYFFKCRECGKEINSQHNYLKKHSGLCISCGHKGPIFGSAYNQLVNNKHSKRVSATITYREFCDLAKITQCHYCDQTINRSSKKGTLGYRGYFLDRKDNNVGYTRENCVPCCWRCNQTKGNRFTYEEFLLISRVLRKIERQRSAKIRCSDGS